MSREKVEVVRAIYDAFNRGDTDAILELVDPAVSVEDRAVIDGATYEGRDGALRFLAFQAEAFNAQSVELEELVDTTDEIVAVIRLRGEGPLSRRSARGPLQPRLGGRRRNGPPPARVRERSRKRSKPPTGENRQGCSPRPQTRYSRRCLRLRRS